jgi:hypothetical protein
MAAYARLTRGGQGWNGLNWRTQSIDCGKSLLRPRCWFGMRGRLMVRAGMDDATVHSLKTGERVCDGGKRRRRQARGWRTGTAGNKLRGDFG